jgi:hypothetical protein
MDPRRNPFSPGAGTRPPELAGRDELLERAEIALDRLAAGRPARGFVFHGLRGVGKTVLLGQIRAEAESRGLRAIRCEAQEDRSLPALLAGPIRACLLKLDRGAAALGAARRALKALAGFAKLKFSYHDLEVALDFDPEPGVADSGDLESDLAELMLAVGAAAHEQQTAVILCIDELQYLREAEMVALISALHAVAQEGLPVGLVGAGLPPLLGRMGRARSYAERLFEFVEVARLDAGAAWNAITRPIEREEEAIEPDAVRAIIAATEGYPYFLQEWGKHAWDLAFCSPISVRDVENATITALAELDSSFFRVRFDRLTPPERRYMRALADLGPGAHKAHQIAERLGRQAPQLAPIRSNLIRKGMLYAPALGDTAFTVPMFDQFMKRIMPVLV